MTTPLWRAVAAGQYVILTSPRSEAVAGIDEEWRPVLKREPLPSPRTDGDGFPTPSELYADLFGPIPIGPGG
jgi:hypothetical protein